VPLLDQVVEKNAGKVKMVFKHFPLRMHRFAGYAAMAAMAAERQNKFWEFHDRLMENHAQLSQPKIQEIARDLKLDMDKFGKDLKDPVLSGKLQQDMADGANAGLRGTPTVFINGKRVKNLTAEGFDAAVAEALKAVGK
jgi:protein-disulfide isomerase